MELASPEDAPLDTPTVSVVIPCFNAGDTLDETVRSALASNHALLEVIVVDDGSDDPHTLRVLEGLRSTVRVVTQANAGLPSARNAGIRHATGSLVLPLDADDLIEPDYVPDAAGVLSSQESVGIVYCRGDRFGESEGPLDLPAFSIEGILVENCIFAAAMFRRVDWELVGGYDESMRRGREDHDFWLRLISLGRDVHRLDGRYFHYRIRSSSMNHGYTREEYIAIYSRIFANNIDLYAAHPEALVRHRFELMDQVNDLRHRYAALERWRRRLPGVHAALRRVKRRIAS